MSTNTIRLHRVLRATPERVYRAFLDADAKAKWLPPNGFTGKVHHLEAKVGGTYLALGDSLAVGYQPNTIPGQQADWSLRDARHGDGARLNSASRLSCNAIISQHLSFAQRAVPSRPSGLLSRIESDAGHMHRNG